MGIHIVLCNLTPMFLVILSNIRQRCCLWVSNFRVTLTLGRHSRIGWDILSRNTVQSRASTRTALKKKLGYNHLYWFTIMPDAEIQWTASSAKFQAFSFQKQRANLTSTSGERTKHSLVSAALRTKCDDSHSYTALVKRRPSNMGRNQ